MQDACASWTEREAAAGRVVSRGVELAMWLVPIGLGAKSAIGKAALADRVLVDAADEGAIRVSEEGLATVQQHLGGLDPASYNKAMLERLQAALGSGNPLSGADRNFYLHELRETGLMDTGLSYPEAHAQALREQGVSEFDLYHPEVIQSLPAQFNDAWFRFWGLEPPLR